MSRCLNHSCKYIHTCTYVEVRQNAKPPRYTDMASAHTTYIHQRGLCMYIVYTAQWNRGARLHRPRLVNQLPDRDYVKPRWGGALKLRSLAPHLAPAHAKPLVVIIIDSGGHYLFKILVFTLTLFRGRLPCDKHCNIFLNTVTLCIIILV